MEAAAQTLQGVGRKLVVSSNGVTRHLRSIFAGIFVIFTTLPAYAQGEKTELLREGNVLLAKWVDCEMTSARVIAKEYRQLEPPDGAKLAEQACTEQREAADGSERCTFPIITHLIEMVRANASQTELASWANAHRDYSCN